MNKTQEFIDHAFFVPANQDVKCPCNRRRNTLCEDKMTLTQHLCKFGFMLGYEVWMQHGESVHQRTASVAEEENDRSGDDETHGPVFSWSSRDNLFIFISFCNMNLLISLHSIFQDDESLGWEEEV
jgi:hypothetical protein